MLGFGTVAVVLLARTKTEKTEPDGPSVDVGPITFDGRAIDVINDYRDNRVGADAKYLNKRVRLVGRADHIGRAKDGTAYVGVCGVASFRRQTEPNVLFLLPKSEEPAIADVKADTDQMVTIEGTCRGRTDDRINRDVQGYEFHINVERCKVIKVEHWSNK